MGLLHHSQETRKFYRKLVVFRIGFKQNRRILTDGRQMIVKLKIHYDEHLNDERTGSEHDPQEVLCQS